MTNSKSVFPPLDNSARSFFVWSAIAFLVVATIIVTWAIDENAYIWLGIEDAPGENLTAVFYFLAGVWLIMMSRQKIKEGSSFGGQTLPILLGLFFIFVAGEEISWGQRVFGFGTPESMMSANKQGEFNLHNLGILDTETAILDQHFALNLFILLQGFVIPIVYRFWPWARQILNRLNFPVVPISCVAFFVFAVVHDKGLRMYFPHWSITEVKEFIFSIGILAFGWAAYRRTNYLK